jgi:hypothetical protein
MIRKTEQNRITIPPNKSNFIIPFKELVVDLGLDWDFYAEVESTEQEFQHKTELRYAILAFAIVGSITFFFGLTRLYDDATENYEHLTFLTALI